MKPTLFPVVWQPRLRALLFQQFRNLPPKDFSVSPPRSVIEAVSDYFAQEAQELEDAAQEVLSIVSIDDSSGVQLQELGRLVGQPFSGESDALFRLRIRARIAANRSSGDPESLYLVFVTMFSLAGQKGQAKILSSPGSIAEFVFRVLGFTLDQRTAAALLDLLLAATVGGDRLLLEWSSAVPSGAFQCSDANALAGPYGPGFASLVPDVIGWTQESPTHAPTARQQPGMAYDSIRKVVTLFGGYNGSIVVADTWTFNGTDWTSLSPGTSPSARSAPAMAFDKLHGVMVVFGGYGGSEKSDTWLFDGTNWSNPTPMTTPTAREGAGMVWDSVRQQIVMFGGTTSHAGAAINETDTWNGTDWTVASPVHKPPARYGFGMVFDEARGVVVIWGGVGASGILSDTWEWNGVDWTEVTTAHSPPAHGFPYMAFDEVLGVTVVFGGQTTNGTWTFDCIDWTQQSPGASPSARWAGGMVFDSVLGSMVLFGGYNGLELAETWEMSSVFNPAGGGMLAGALSD